MKRIRAILAAVDFSESSNSAFETAVDLAKQYAADLHLFHALEVPASLFNPYAISARTSFIKEARDVSARKLEKSYQEATAAGVVVKAHLGQAPVAGAIVELAGQLAVDLIVMGTRGYTGFKHFLLGSVAERTVGEADCNVLTVKGSGAAERILAAVDFSDHGDRALDAAVGFSREFGAELHIVHALDVWIPVMTPYEVAVPAMLFEGAREAAARRLEALVQKVVAEGVTPTPHLTEAPAASAIVGLAEKIGADLIVMGTHGHTGLSEVLLGSVAERTLRHAPCSVLTVKTPSLWVRG